MRGLKPMRTLGGDILSAGVVAGIFSGLPSTLHALQGGGDPLAASYAAGSLLVGSDASPWRLLRAAAVVHTVLSLGWAGVFSVTLPRRAPAGVAVVSGALGGLGVAVVDLGLIGRRFPRVRALPLAPQVADHLAFGALVGLVLAHRGRIQSPSTPAARAA